jgi:hypothetical protein
MADFPENDVNALEIDDVSEAFIEGVRAGFRRDGLATMTSFEDIGPKPKRDLLKKMSAARKTILRLFADAAAQDRLDRVRAIATEMVRGNFPNARTRLAELTALPPRAFPLDFSSAFNTAPVNFVVIEFEENPTPGKPPIRKEVPASIPAYAGPKPGDQAGHRLAALNDFLAKGTEHTFRTVLLQAEIDAGQRNFADAIDAYGIALGAAAADGARRKFVAVRTALAHLGLGDQRFRSTRVPTDQDRQAIAEAYDRAIGVLDEQGVAPENPLRQQVEAHAAAQKAKLENGLNFLGLWDAFVPNQRFTALQQAAAAQIELANDFAEIFTAFLTQADAEKEEQGDLQQQRAEESLNLNIIERRRAIAALSIEKIDEQLRAIKDQQEFLLPATVIGSLRSIVDGASRDGAVGPLSGVLGVAGNVVNFADQSEQLGHQRVMAQVEKDIARHQAAIVGVERQVSELRLAFYEQKLAFLQGKRFNADVLYELAALNEQRAVRLLEAAILLAYLFERALAFNLGEVESRRIRFDYLDQPLGVVEAVKALRLDFTHVASQIDTLLEQQKISPFIESISLRESYPIQFSRFLQTGEMDFVYSLYQLSKRRPATHRCRLREVGVEIKGLIPPTGFSGVLTHSGRFLVRDRDATVVDGQVTRLVPTEDQLEKALEEQRRAGLAAAVVGGVLYYTLESETKELSQKTQFVSPDQPSEATLDLFEGIGPTGLWHLEIREHGKLAISDILLHLAIVSRESDPFALESKVETLIDAFERELADGDRLDRFSSFSLRQSFPDAFFALQNGGGDMALTADDFPRGLVNLQFKAAIAQVVDQAGKGVADVALEIARSDSAFALARSTRADGFSEDLDAELRSLPPAERFPVVGAWKLRLPDPAQFARIGDLRLFFLHTFDEI